MRKRRALSGLLAAALVPIAWLAPPPASGAPAFPSIGEIGITFSASVPSDVQRDEGEPEVSIDPGGNIYTCGPSGFASVADYAQVSRDGGDQFHLIGQPPRGQISGGEGGGDCGLASAPYPNSKDQYTWAYTGLGPLINFSTGSSDDTGRSLRVSPVSESIPGVDRQWLVFTDVDTVLFSYNHYARGYMVQKSTDGGVTYGPPTELGGQLLGSRPGPIRAILSPDKDPGKAIVYFPAYVDTTIALHRSMDGGTTWDTCAVHDAGTDPSAGFVVADHDREGNVYIAFAQKGAPDDRGVGNDTYVVVAEREQLAGCTVDADPIGTGTMARVNRDEVETTVMPWLVAGGAPGRVAVAFYGTDSIGDPDDGTGFKAAWYPYVNVSLDALGARPSWSQTRAVAHPTHYDSICLNGLGCIGSGGDRSLVDYFTMDLDPVTGRLVVAYNNTAKRPDEPEGHVGHPVVFVQETGPSLLGTTLERRKDNGVPRQVLRTTSVDRVGDALTPYGTLCPPVGVCSEPPTANEPALDIERVEVGPEIDLATGAKVEDGGMTVTIDAADLSGGALRSALSRNTAAGNPTSSLMWLFRWVNGHQPVGATARWDEARGFTFGYDDYTTASTQSGQVDPTGEKIVVWPGAQEIPGDVDADTGVIRLSISRDKLRALGPLDDKGRPTEMPAASGDRLYDAVAYSFTSPALPEAQTYLYPVDNAPAMDVLGPGGGARSVPVDPAPAPA
ncbi:MAG TPA: hypothetical protein VNA12_01300, partial [Mycobacteriales bacterium]|nr:hypothetical protein [Mycobacteriales bacterium]